MVQTRIVTGLVIYPVRGNQLVPQKVNQWRAGINTTDARRSNTKLCDMHLQSFLQLSIGEQSEFGHSCSVFLFLIN